MANKLKEGVQDALVYLRMLEGAKLAPVYERKRVQLMNKLLDVQGDTRKEAPVKLDDDDDDEEDEEEETTGGAAGGASSPEKKSEKRNSKVFDTTKSRFDQPQTKTTYKYKTLEELKKEREMKKLGIPLKDETKMEESEKEESPPTKQKEVENKQPVEEKQEPAAVNEIKEEEASIKDEPGPATEEQPMKEIEDNADTSQQQTELDHQTKKRSHTLGISGFKKKLFGKRERSSTAGSSVDSEVHEDNVSQVSAEEVNQIPPAEEVEELTEEAENEGLHFSSKLERVTRQLGKYRYHKMTLTLENDTVTMMKPKDKNGTRISLIGAATVASDTYQFQLHTADKSYTFQTDSEELTVKWVDTLMYAIDACTPAPPEENSTDAPEVPEINVLEVEPIPEEIPTPTHQTLPNIKESRSYENIVPGKKKKQEMPEPTSFQATGYFFKKATIGWDKVWLGLTFDNGLYMSQSETSKKIIQMIPIAVETKLEKKKGSDKYPHGVIINTGKGKDMLATDSKKDFDYWMSYLEQATGSAEIMELLSEDEDADEGGDLYEDLGDVAAQVIPYIPSTPRPAPAVPSSNGYPGGPPPASTGYPASEELYDDFDQDIYEGLDDIDMPPVNSMPSLPPRNEVKNPPAPAPTLPPRKQQEEIPSLPPRPPKGNPAPMDYEAPTISPSLSKKPPPPVAAEDEELYDDVMGAGQKAMGVVLEETYDDVEVPGTEDDAEEMYDDVSNIQQKLPALSKKESASELYEDMDPNQAAATNYVKMVPPTSQIQEESDELYVDVDEPPPRPPPPSSASTKIPTRPPPPASVTTTTTKPLSPLVKQKTEESPPPSSPSSIKKASTLPSSRSSPSSVKKTVPTSSKVTNLTKKFSEASTSPTTSSKNKRGLYSETLQYMGPGAKTFASEWIVLEGTTLIFYKGVNEKFSHFRVNLKEANLTLGAPNNSAATNEFHITKSQLTYRFSTNDMQELAAWIGPIASVITKVTPSPDNLYQALEDHTGQDGELSFKKGEVVWVLGQNNPSTWTGIAGANIKSFNSSNGTFPSNKIGHFTATDDMYI
jgi:hypothetical protein